jgi:hypothetical protein
MVSPELATLEVLSQQIDYDADALDTYDRYMRGKHRPTANTNALKKLKLSEPVDNWCPTIVNAKAERLNLQGAFRVGDTVSEDAGTYWRRSNMGLWSPVAHRTALVFRRCPLFVWADENGEPTISVEHPRQFRVQYAAGNPRVVTTALRKWVGYDGTAHATLILPDRILTYRSKGQVAVVDVSVPDPQRTVLNTRRRARRESARARPGRRATEHLGTSRGSALRT